MLFAIAIKKSRPIEYIIGTYEKQHSSLFKFAMNGTGLIGNNVKEYTQKAEDALLFDTYSKAKKFVQHYNLGNVEIVTVVAKIYKKEWNIVTEIKKPKATKEKVIKVKKDKVIVDRFSL